MILYRISNHADLSGLGGELADGRWHTRDKGRRIVYTSDHPALCILEILVHINNVEDMPNDYQLLRIEVSDEHIKHQGPMIVEGGDSPSYDYLTNLAITQGLGNSWLHFEDSGGLLVPSVLAPFAKNCLLNPRVPEIAAIKPEVVGRFPFDKRLLRHFNHT